MNQDTYYVVAHFHYTLSLTAVFVVTAGLYLLLDLFRLRYLPALAWWHFGVTLLGTCLIFAPMMFLNLSGLPMRHVNPERLLSIVSAISGLGYVLTLAGLAIFAWIVGAALLGVKAPR